MVRSSSERLFRNWQSHRNFWTLWPDLLKLCVLKNVQTWYHMQTNWSIKGAHRGLRLSNEQDSAHCRFSTFPLMNMQHGAFLPGCAKNKEEKIQIYYLSTSIANYQARKRCQWLQFASVFNTFERNVFIGPVLCTDGCCYWEDEDS